MNIHQHPLSKKVLGACFSSSFIQIVIDVSKNKANKDGMAGMQSKFQKSLYNDKNVTWIPWGM